MKKKNLELITALRHELHMHPELSCEEVWTKGTLMEFVKSHTSLEVVDRGLWFYAKYTAANPTKPPIGLRADFDALPIDDHGTTPWVSRVPHKAHLCGHDGHSSTLAGVALELDENGADRDVYLIFQHAEEIGAGGEPCSQLITEKGIAEVFAFHNTPGGEPGWLAYKSGSNCCASKGITFYFTGTSAHASTPEAGRNPGLAIANVITAVPGFIRPEDHKGLILATLIEVVIGEEAYGTSAHKGKVGFTIRAELEEEMNELYNNIYNKCKEQAEIYGLELEASERDVFPVTASTDKGIERIKAAAAAAGVTAIDRGYVGLGSEDFGYYTKLADGGMFWMLTGKDGPMPHADTFDFMDLLIEPACDVFMQLIKQ